jgi:hypothetical protein
MNTRTQQFHAIHVHEETYKRILKHVGQGRKICWFISMLLDQYEKAVQNSKEVEVYFEKDNAN